jgi:hypothetical protein
MAIGTRNYHAMRGERQLDTAGADAPALGVELAVPAATDCYARDQFTLYPSTSQRRLERPLRVEPPRSLARAGRSGIGDLDSAFASTGIVSVLAQVRLMRGWELASQTDDRGMLTELSEGSADYRATGARAWQTNFLALLAIGYLPARKYAEGLSSIAEALRLVTLRYRRGQGGPSIGDCGPKASVSRQNRKAWTALNTGNIVLIPGRTAS